MISDSWLDRLAVTARIVLGCAFLFASIEKTADPSAFTESITHYKLLPREAAVIAATFLPWIELLCGVGLIAGAWIRGSALLCLIMLLVFTAAGISALARGLDISCGCFSQDPDVGKLGWMKIGENGLLLAASLLVLLRPAEVFFLRRDSHHGADQGK